MLQCSNIQQSVAISSDQSLSCAQFGYSIMVDKFGQAVGMILLSDFHCEDFDLIAFYLKLHLPVLHFHCLIYIVPLDLLTSSWKFFKFNYSYSWHYTLILSKCYASSQESLRILLCISYLIDRFMSDCSFDYLCLVFLTIFLLSFIFVK